MTAADFIASITQGEPPAGLNPCQTAMWYEKRGDWDRAHQIVQDLETPTAALIHAYLHRREGDEPNARYWYGQAGRRFPTGVALDDEWQSITGALFADE